MNLKDYIKGTRRGKEANRLEREAMNDLFLQDAIDGFDKVQGNHSEIIDKLEKRVIYISSRKKQRNWMLFGSVAASFLLVIGFSYYFLFVKNLNNSILIAENKSPLSEPSEPYFEETEILDIQHEEWKTTPMVPIVESMESFADAESFEYLEDSKMPENLAMNIDEKEIAFYKDEKRVVSEKNEEESVALVDNARADNNRKDISNYETTSKSKPSASKSETHEATAKKQQALKPAIFGEREFLEYCKEKSDKNVCGGKGAKVKVTFFINASGKTEDSIFSSYSCEEARKEVEKLLVSSPVWTEKSRKVSMTIEW